MPELCERGLHQEKNYHNNEDRKRGEKKIQPGQLIHTPVYQ